METFNFKKFMLPVLILIMAIILPTKIFAANESVAIVKIENDYSIYINGLENKDFKFAFTNQNTEEKKKIIEKIIEEPEEHIEVENEMENQVSDVDIKKDSETERRYESDQEKMILDLFDGKYID